MSSFLTAWPLVVKRGLAHWRILTSVVVGVLLASTMMASTVIYFDTLRELALIHALKIEDPHRLDIVGSTELRRTSAEEYLRVSGAVDKQVDTHLSWLVNGYVNAAKTPTLYLTGSGDEDSAGQDDRRAYFAFTPELAQYVTLLSGGHLPGDDPLQSATGTLQLEAIIPIDDADLLGISVGQVLSAIPAKETDLPYVSVRITGVFQKTDPDAPFWYLYDRALQPGTVSTLQTVPLFISLDAYLGVLGPALGNLESTYTWLIDVDSERLDSTNTSIAESNLLATNNQVNASVGGYRMSTSLFRVFDEHETRLFFIKAPMLVFLILVVVVILYYVVTISSLLLEEQRGEIALLRSRGATTRQILLVFALEGAAIAFLAALAGPLLAAGFIALLGSVPAFSELGADTLLPVRITIAAYQMSILGALLSFMALMIPAYQASRIGVATHRQQSSRPSNKPFFHKYYLDVLLLLAGIMLIRQLNEQGSVLATGVLGELAVNQLLSAVPGLVLVAVAMILLRLFPLVLNLVDRISSRWMPVGLVLGIWQMARDPTHYARLSLLLVLTAGLGVFASGFVQTLEQSFEERVLYATGSDIRIQGVEFDSTNLRSDLIGRYEQDAAIDNASLVYRGIGFDIARPKVDSFRVLGVDAATFGDVAWTRRDFSDKPLLGLLESLRSTELPVGIPLPDGAESIGISLKVNKAEPDLRLYARFKDANDRYFSQQLGRLGKRDQFGNVVKPDWLHLWSNLEDRLAIEDPLTLISIGIGAPFYRGRLPRGSVEIDEIWTTTFPQENGQTFVDGERDVLESFDDVSGWNVMRLNPDSLSDDLRGADAGHNEFGSAFFTWAEAKPMTSRGVFYGSQGASLPVLVSESFISEKGYRLGDEIHISVEGRSIPVRLEETIDLFPTANPFREQFLIADLTSLVRYANLDPIGEEFQPNEVWLSTYGNEDERARFMEELADDSFNGPFVDDRAKRMTDSLVDPLATAGWSALLFIAFAAILVTSGIGFFVHVYVSIRNRQVQFALMRTMGFSSKQLLVLVGLEQAFVIASAMALGTWMGGRLGTIIIPFLGHDDGGAQIVPPLVVAIDWVNLSIIYVSMALVFFFIISGVIWFIRRLTLQHLLRLGE